MSKQSGRRAESGAMPARESVGRRILRGAGHALFFLFVTVVMVIVLLVGLVRLAVGGTSEAFKSQFILFAYETSALKWLPYWFLDDAEVDEIIAKNQMPEVEDGTMSDETLIVISEEPIPEDVEPITIEEINGGTYHGYMMTVMDPSRVFLGTVDQFFEGSGWVVQQMCEKYGAIGGINGGDFIDMGSYSYTAMPIGGVISQGVGVHEANSGGKWNLISMTSDNKLILLKGYTVQEALALGVRDAVHTVHETGPFLIVDGEPMEVPDTEVYGGGKNPRTAIGQRADGAMLLCVVDGRQASSLGATFKEMIDIMQDYGAVNAACLDGGTSTQMVYEGEIVNNPYSPTGPRRCPTAWMVAREEGTSNE